MITLALFGGEALLFLLITLNTRAVAKNKLSGVLMTDSCIAFMNFALIGWVSQHSGMLNQLAYVAGGVTGSFLGMKISKNWKEHGVSGRLP